ncbi:MAG TPA: hypothetical protein VII66_03840, partial [Gemmatimonadaceae bacterium]
MKARSIVIFVSVITVPSACAGYELRPDYETPACVGYHRPVSTIVADSSYSIVVRRLAMTFRRIHS